MTEQIKIQTTEKYEQLLKETRGAKDHYEQTAKVNVPEMWKELHHVLGIPREQARARMEKDLGWGKWSLIKFLPEEAKDQDKRPGGFASAEERRIKNLEKVRQEKEIILEEKETKQIFLLYVDGKRRMKIDENKEVTALD